MARGSGLQFTLAGFAVSVPLNTLLGVALIAWIWLPSFAGTGPRPVISAVVFAVALLASVLLHELAHAAVARRYGFPVLGITLWAFGGFTSYRPVRNTPRREAAIAAAGPAATMLVAVAAWLAYRGLPASMAADILGAVALANGLVAVFNMLPGLPLDGGSVLSAGIWAMTGSRARGQRVAAYAGMVLAALLVAAPLLLAAAAGTPVDLWLMVVGALVAAFLFLGARSALQQADARRELEGRRALDLAVPALVVPPAMSLTELDALIARSARPDRQLIALVGGPDALHGIVLPAAAAAVPPDRRSQTQVWSVTRSVPQWRWIGAGAPAADALELAHAAPEPVLVLDGANRPVGVLMAAPVTD